MKKILTFALMAMVALSASAAKKKAPAKDKNKPVFTTIKENPITSIKDQNRSGTCWDYSTLSFFEAEILKATGKEYDLDESFVANKTWSAPSRWFATTAIASLHRAEAPRTCWPR